MNPCKIIYEIFALIFWAPRALPRPMLQTSAFRGATCVPMPSLFVCPHISDFRPLRSFIPIPLASSDPPPAGRDRHPQHTLTVWGGWAAGIELPGAEPPFLNTASRPSSPMLHEFRYFSFSNSANLHFHFFTTQYQYFRRILLRLAAEVHITAHTPNIPPCNLDHRIRMYLDRRICSIIWPSFF